MKRTPLFWSALVLIALSNGLVGCQSTGKTTDTNTAPASTNEAEANASATPTNVNETADASADADPTKIPAGNRNAGPVADAATIIARKQVPVLCYHQIRDWKSTDSKSAKDYIVPLATFEGHMKMLSDSGYHTISPDQLHAYLTTGAKLPEKPVMLTFDDGDLTQYTNALPIMDKYGFKASFYIMTVAIGRRGKQHYMDKTQLKDLSDKGHVIAAHTWDHQNVKKLVTPEDWKTQLEEPKAKLEEITGKPVRHFAYPFGLWKEESLPEVAKRGYATAYQLAEKKMNPDLPLMSIRRIIAGGYWSAKTLSGNIRASFR
ncbi:MAG: polysaccharide deacetylase family protein [Cytophagales bacterium]|nr:MAG: polysaccharide deacetylase family protein [Cytophagales bacterium]